MTARSEPAPRGAATRIAFVQSCWHRDIVDQLRIAFLAEIERLGHAAGSIDFYEVPGAYEIPLQAQLLAKTGRYAAIVGAGLVVDGGLYRHDFVGQTVIEALMRVQLDTQVPVLSAVLTPHHFHEHDDHKKFYYEHFAVKGREAASAAARTIENVARIAKLSL